MDLAWKKLRPAELPALEAFLRSREEDAAGFIGRILRDGRLRIPSSARSVIAIAVDREAVGPAAASPGAGREGDARQDAEGRSRGLPVVRGAILKLGMGLVFPLLPPRAGPGPDRIPPSLGERTSSVVGPAADVERLESALSLRPLVAVRYDLMSRKPHSSALRRGAAPAGLRVYCAGADNLDELSPLQEAYEKEEVLTAIHRFDPAGSRASLARALRDQVVVFGRLDGAAIAKAATNARAFSLDQMGGVFVAPPYRRRGIGSAVVSALLSILESEDRGTVLFVKKGNEAAKGLYDELGFATLGGYRADYFMP